MITLKFKKFYGILIKDLLKEKIETEKYIEDLYYLM